MTSLDENKAIARKFITEVIGNGNMASISELLVPGSFLAGGTEGFINAFRSGFTDWEAVIEDIFGEGEKIAVQVRLSGIQTGPVMGRPPTGKSFSTTCLYHMKVRDEKIISMIFMLNGRDLDQQLGYAQVKA